MGRPVAAARPDAAHRHETTSRAWPAGPTTGPRCGRRSRPPRGLRSSRRTPNTRQLSAAAQAAHAAAEQARHDLTERPGRAGPAARPVRLRGLDARPGRPARRPRTRHRRHPPAADRHPGPHHRPHRRAGPARPTRRPAHPGTSHLADAARHRTPPAAIGPHPQAGGVGLPPTHARGARTPGPPAVPAAASADDRRLPAVPDLGHRCRYCRKTGGCRRNLGRRCH